jgi:hypothetical protein
MCRLFCHPKVKISMANNPHQYILKVSLVSLLARNVCQSWTFFLEAFCDISHRLGGITPLGVFSDAFPGLKMRVTFACATANFLTHFIISIAVLENVPPDAGLQKNATFPH